MRQRLRNPSGRFALVIGLISLAIFVGAMMPTFIGGVDNYKEAKRLKSREFAPPPGAWVRPWLVQKVNIMLGAEQPIQWRPVDFVYGPCAAENTRQLPNQQFREAIQYSCVELRRIQLAYAGDCATTNNCDVKLVAKDELRAVVAVLDTAFEHAGFVEPITEEQ